MCSCDWVSADPLWFMRGHAVHCPAGTLSFGAPFLGQEGLAHVRLLQLLGNAYGLVSS
jgi:hypothetical protein